jgi:hypothetical protein
MEVHHGGVLLGNGPQRVYMDEKLDWFDSCDADTWSSLCIDDCLGQLGIKTRVSSQKVHWLLPGKDIANGLRVVCTDIDTNIMVSVIDMVKNLVIYVDQDDLLDGVNWYDLVSNPNANVPKETRVDNTSRDADNAAAV